ncbi:MAG TPA: hypothetical protein ENK19_08590 [Acidobacteria bacterium]|nr:hypothetical protein [Acidobacteriota bacterium]
MTKTLSRDEILAAGRKLKQEEVDVPELGGTVIVREMSGSERDSWEASLLDTRGPDPVMNLANTRAKLLVRTIVDADGKRLFTDDEIDLVGALSASALDRLFAVAARLSRVSAADVEELAKNSPGARSAASGSSSRKS